MDFRIRAVGVDDAEALRTLIAAMGYDVGAEELRGRLETLPAGDAVFVAESGGAGLGWVHALVTHSLIVGPRVEIAGLSIVPRAQGHGVGSALLAAAEGWAVRQGVRTVYLRSGMERHEAHAFYLARGYTAVKTQLALTKRLT
ncbi:GNAT family N-acetyltransferase [Dactylosporangium sp. NPDC051541]|uniref:GNAT family N-acetyltransferase n=1 Tax=Dactylosporangium sp. NPDC051541 TaxID=3363977 RepID=UPI0037976261